MEKASNLLTTVVFGTITFFGLGVILAVLIAWGDGAYSFYELRMYKLIGLSIWFFGFMTGVIGGLVSWVVYHFAAKYTYELARTKVTSEVQKACEVETAGLIDQKRKQWRVETAGLILETKRAREHVSLREMILCLTPLVKKKINLCPFVFDNSPDQSMYAVKLGPRGVQIMVGYGQGKPAIVVLPPEMCDLKVDEYHGNSPRFEELIFVSEEPEESSGNESDLHRVRMIVALMTSVIVYDVSPANLLGYASQVSLIVHKRFVGQLPQVLMVKPDLVQQSLSAESGDVESASSEEEAPE